MLTSHVAAAPPGFVTRSGTKFMLDGKPFYVGGTSTHYLGWGTRKEVDAVLEDARKMNFNVVRSILHSVIGAPDGSKPHIWNFASTSDSSNMGMHGVYVLYWNPTTNSWAWNDSTVNGLGRWDYVIYKAKSLGLKLNISLIDFWRWAGGTQQINAWYGTQYPNAANNNAQNYYDFYTDARMKQLYKDWVNHVLNRVNSITGVRYKDDPTIFAWDLMNEPEFAWDRLGYGRDWLMEMSAYVKSIDRNHLLSAGSESRMKPDGTRINGFDPEAVLSLPNIDFGTWHTYPAYHDELASPAAVVDLIKQHGQIAARQKKPVIIQEFGYSFKKPDRAAVYKSWTDAVYNNSNSAGWIVWRIEGRVVTPPTRNFPEAENDPLGDYPPDNGESFSFFNNDSATSRVLAQAAAKITARNKQQVLKKRATPSTNKTKGPKA
jgi:mannan endo-1,4-beta-mannosidase